MRFLFLITHYYPHVYGAETFAQTLAEHLVKKGHQVDLVTGRWQHNWLGRQTVNGVNLYRVKVIKLRFLQTMFFILPQFLQASRLLKKHHYDYVHAHIFPSLITAALVRTKARKIVTLQGGDLGDYPEIYGPFAGLFKAIIAACLGSYDRIHVVSHDLSNQVKTLSGRSSLVIPNAVHQSLFNLKKTSLKNSPPLIYSPSRLTPKNNLANLIKAIALLKKQAIDVQLKIAGTGRLKSKLERLINQLGLQDRVFLLGYLDRSANLELISQADLVARVSLQEGFGIALLEALALKTSVVASQAGGLKDFISPKNAFIPANSSPSALARTIKTALTRPRLASQKIQAGYRLLRSRYTYKRIFKKFLCQVYEL